MSTLYIPSPAFIDITISPYQEATKQNDKYESEMYLLPVSNIPPTIGIHMKILNISDSLGTCRKMVTL